MNNHYLYTRRPPGIGCQPRGWKHRESWLPGKRINDRLCFGVVVYEQALTPEQVGRYELWVQSFKPEASQWK